MKSKTEKVELPTPPKGLRPSLAAIGPGLIMASLAIGAGELVLFPTMIVKHGPMLMWIAIVGCIIQAALAVESMRYTAYCGQPIHQAYMKLGKPLMWAWTWSLLLFIPVMWPGWAAISATAVASAILGRPPHIAC